MKYNEVTLIAEVILPVPVKSNFDYRVSAAYTDRIAVGSRVVVHFGKSKLYTGVVKRLYEQPEIGEHRQLKPIEDVPDDQPVLLPKQLELFEWMAFYYFCTEGEVLKASLPSGLKLESEAIVEWIDLEDWEDLDLDEPTYQLFSILHHQKVLTAKEVGEIWNINSPANRLRNLEARGLIRRGHRLQTGYKPKMIKFIRLAPDFQNDEALKEAFDSLTNAPRQEEVLMLVVSEWFQQNELQKAVLKKRVDGADSSIKSLVKKGILEEFEVKADRVAALEFKKKEKEITYTDEQAAALAKIRSSFEEKPTQPVLLHGVTGAGKTHLYIDLIREALDRGEDVLYLLPEIALTQQIIDKVKSEFGELVGVYHSRFNDAERVEIWQKVISGDFRVVIGVRSSIFVPFKNLGLIVVDEEHDTSFKQNEPNPRYHARDVAIYMAHLFGARVLLGSATPSFESYYNARLGKFTLVEIKNRAVKAELPALHIIDMREQRKKRLLKSYFSQPFLKAIEETLQRKEQGIIFQNRRGFVPWLTCMNCGHVPRCINCDITLTFHKRKGELRCHYCGYTDYEFSKCEQCGSYELKQQGIGTERIEEELQALFPEARIARMDLDTTRSRTGFLKLIRQFEEHQVDLLVGTQMVSKGLDFDNVTLVGVVEADLMLNFADFRAYEHAYQLLTQVSGRAGRSTKKGRVMIQTFLPDNPVLQVLQQPFGIFFDLESENRKQLHYPPFTRLIRIELRHKNQLFLEAQAEALRNILLPTFGKGLLGPEYPHVTRLRNEYRQVALLKITRGSNVKRLREILAARIDFYYRNAENKSMRIVVDVDPM